MNEVPVWHAISGVPSPTPKPTKFMFAVDPVTGRISAWNLHNWVTLAISGGLSGDVEIYVDSVAGLDTNPGTAAAPVRTLTAAIALLPPTWTGACRIIDARATGSTLDLPADLAVGRPTDNGEPLLIQGVMVDAGPSLGLPAIGTHAISVVSGVGPGTIISNANTMVALGITADQLAGCWIRFTSGLRSGQRYIIGTNTLSGPGLQNCNLYLENLAWDPAAVPVPTDTFVIERPATVLRTPATAVGTTRPVGTALVDQLVAFRHVTFSLRTGLTIEGGLVYVEGVRVRIDPAVLAGAAVYLAVMAGGLVAGCLRAIVPGAFADLPDADESAGGLACDSDVAAVSSWSLVSDEGGDVLAFTSTLRGSVQVFGLTGSNQKWAASNANTTYTPFVANALMVLGNSLSAGVSAEAGAGNVVISVAGPGAEFWGTGLTLTGGATGIQVSSGGHARLSTASSSALTGYGLIARNGGQIGYSSCTITGTAGDAQVDAVATSYADMSSGVMSELGSFIGPATGSNNMHPVPSMKVRAMATASIANLTACPVLQDGVTLIENDLLFVNDGASPDGIVAVSDIYNGPYRVGAVVAGNAPLTRWFGAVTAKRLAGSQVIVESGTTHRGHAYELQMSAAEITVNVTPIKWTERGTTIVGDVLLYVDTATGSDTNPGTATRPVATLERAFQLVPPAWTGKCRINLTAGQTVAMPANVGIGRPVGPGAEPLCIVGPMATLVSGTITASGASALTGREDVTDGALVMPVDTAAGTGYAGAFLRYTSGARSGERYQVGTNTATTCTLISGDLSSGAGRPGVGVTFVVEQPGATVDFSGIANLSYFAGLHICFYGVNLAFGTKSMRFRSCILSIDCCTLSSTGAAAHQLSGCEMRCLPLRYTYVGQFADLYTYTSSGMGGTYVVGAGSGISFGLYAGYYRFGKVVARGVFGWVPTNNARFETQTFDMRCSTTGWLMQANDSASVSLGLSSCTSVATVVGGGDAFQVNDGARLALWLADFAGETDAVYCKRGAFLDANGLTSSAGALVGGYGLVAESGSVIRIHDSSTPATSVTGALGDFSVDGIVGTYALHKANGVRGELTGATLSTNVPVLEDPAVETATSEYQRFVGRIGNGVATVAITNHLVTAATKLRCTPVSQTAAKYFTGWTVGLNTVTLNASTNGADNVDVLVEILG